MKLRIRNLFLVLQIFCLTACGYRFQTIANSKSPAYFRTQQNREFNALSTGCPADWICPPSPIYTSRIGAWYALYWNTVSSPYFHWKDWTRFQPLQGYYGSGDPTIIRTHISEMKSAGIEFLVLDHTNGIYNDGGTIDQNAKSIFDTNALLPESQSLPIGIVIGNALGADHSTSEQNAESEYIWNTYTQRPNYLQWNGKPLLVVFNPVERPDAFDPEWTDNRFTVRRAGGLVDSANPLLQKFATEGLWGWVTYYPQLVSPETITVMPGWNSKHLGRDTIPVDREDGAFYQRQWLYAIKHNPQNIVINSWNEFAEETAIEPAYATTAPVWRDSYGTEVPDWYLQITTAYTHLRQGLMPGVFYRDEDDATVYQVTNSNLIPQYVMPHGHPVILLPAGTLRALRGEAPLVIPEGLFMVGASIFYSNGSYFCQFATMEAYTSITGRTEANGIPQYSQIPATMIQDSNCGGEQAPPSPPEKSPAPVEPLPPIPEGLFMAGAGIFYSNGSHFCQFATMETYTSITGRTEANGIPQYSQIPATMTQDSNCGN